MTVGIFVGGGPFRSQRGISLQKGNFAGVLQLISQLRNGTHVLGSGLTAAKIFAGWEGRLVAAKWFRRGTLFLQHNPIFA